MDAAIGGSLRRAACRSVVGFGTGSLLLAAQERDEETLPVARTAAQSGRAQRLAGARIDDHVVRRRRRRSDLVAQLAVGSELLGRQRALHVDVMPTLDESLLQQLGDRRTGEDVLFHPATAASIEPG